MTEVFAEFAQRCDWIEVRSFHDSIPIEENSRGGILCTRVPIHGRGVQHGFRPGKRLGKITATTAAPKKEIPVSRAMRRPWRNSFSAKMMMVSAAITGIFITPTARRISIKPQQQPTQ